VKKLLKYLTSIDDNGPASPKPASVRVAEVVKETISKQKGKTVFTKTI